MATAVVVLQSCFVAYRAHQQKSAERALSQRARHVQDKVDEGQVNDLAI